MTNMTGISTEKQSKISNWISDTPLRTQKARKTSFKESERVPEISIKEGAKKLAEVLTRSLVMDELSTRQDRVRVTLRRQGHKTHYYLKIDPLTAEDLASHLESKRRPPRTEETRTAAECAVTPSSTRQDLPVPQNTMYSGGQAAWSRYAPLTSTATGSIPYTMSQTTWAEQHPYCAWQQTASYQVGGYGPVELPGSRVDGDDSSTASTVRFAPQRTHMPPSPACSSNTSPTSFNASAETFPKSGSITPPPDASSSYPSSTKESATVMHKASRNSRSKFDEVSRRSRGSHRCM